MAKTVQITLPKWQVCALRNLAEREEKTVAEFIDSVMMESQFRRGWQVEKNPWATFVELASMVQGGDRKCATVA